MATWTIGGQTLAELGLEFAGGTFRTGTASEMRLRRGGDFTATHLFNHGQSVVLQRDGAPYFQGKVRDRSAGATPSDEGQDIVIVDAWDELEATVYHEPWSAGAGSVDLPIAILGRNSAGADITDSQQISEAIAFAVTAGISIQAGSLPTGLPLWPSEVRNQSIAEVIRLSLRFHPDWIPWIDHSTSPPTLNVTPRASMSIRTIAIANGDVSGVNIRRRDDLKADAVRLVYLTANLIDGEVYRDGIIDKYPLAGPDHGPRVLSSVIELAGGQMQFQKSRVQVRELPDDQESAKAWLKLKFPKIKDVDDAHFSVTKWTKELLADEDEHPDPVNPRATRLDVDDVDDLPNELVRGGIEDWMQKKVGRVRIGFQIAIDGEASNAERVALESITGMKAVTVTATNAVTKIYKGVSQWAPPEQVPTGIAQSVYNALSAYQFEGSVTTTTQDVTATRFHGCRLRVSGGHADWSGMDALIHSVDFEIETGTMTVSVGPAPFLGAEDMLELQRMLRGRSVTWMYEDERTSNELGAEFDPGSKGDTVGPYDQPETVTEFERGMQWRFFPSVAGTTLTIGPGSVRYHEVKKKESGEEDEPPRTLRAVWPKLDGVALYPGPATYDISGKSGASVWLICKADTCSTHLPVEGEPDPERIVIANKTSVPAAEDGEVRMLLAKFDLEDEEGGSGKVISGPEFIVQSDVVIPFTCDPDTDDNSEDDEDWSADSSGSGGGGEVPSGSSDSEEEPPLSTCPWTASARWTNKPTCVNKNPFGGPTRYQLDMAVTVTLPGGLTTGGMCDRCPNWWAEVTLPGDWRPINVVGGTIQGNTVRYPLGPDCADSRSINWITDNYQPCVEQPVTIRVRSSPHPDEDNTDPCCGVTLTPRTGRWFTPPFCGESCSTSPPPPPP